MLRKIYFYSSVACIYIFTAGIIGAALDMSHTFGTPVSTNETPPMKPSSVVQPHRNTPIKVTSGQPMHIRIPIRGIDLAIEEGKYNAASKSWTLSPTRALFAVSTMPANDQTGATFVYGHGTESVFGKLGTSRPPIGSVAEIRTDNDHVFTYVLRSIRDLSPTDTSILRGATTGPPRLIVQTCTGAFSEWRTEFIYSFQKVH